MVDTIEADSFNWFRYHQLLLACRRTAGQALQNIQPTPVQVKTLANISQHNQDHQLPIMATTEQFHALLLPPDIPLLTCSMDLLGTPCLSATSCASLLTTPNNRDLSDKIPSKSLMVACSCDCSSVSLPASSAVSLLRVSLSTPSACRADRPNLLMSACSAAAPSLASRIACSSQTHLASDVTPPDGRHGDIHIIMSVTAGNWHAGIGVGLCKLEDATV